MSQYFVPLMPLFLTLPLAVAAVVIARIFVRSRERGKDPHADLDAIREEVSALRQSQAEILERLDFAERMLTQVREARHGLPPAGSS